MFVKAHGTLPYREVQEQVRKGLLSPAGAASVAALWSSPKTPEGQTFQAFSSGQRVPLSVLADAVDAELARTPQDPELNALQEWIWEQD